MISILIPIYNWDCRQLIQDLSDQCLRSQLEFEILCFDDGSKTDYKIINREISTLLNVSYVELKKNIGRSAIRNRLAQYARFENLLFLDCDSTVVKDLFIKNYVVTLREYDVIYGGTCYQKDSPSKEYMLRWKYGKLRENVPVIKRQARGNSHFMTNNFAIKKSVFEKFQFDTSIDGYGYEDSVFAFNLERDNYKVFHIDNPVRHDGLDENEEYLRKVKNSIQNLVRLRTNHQVRGTKITNLYDQLRFLKLDKFVIRILVSFDMKMKKNLTSGNPIIRVLDLWKLMNYGLICGEQQKIQP